MDVKQIERLEALLAKATPGPWEACNGDTGGCICGGVHSVADDCGVAATGSVLEDLFCGQQEDNGHRIRANAVLIAEAITALPALLQLARAYAEAPKVTVSQTWMGNGVVYAEVFTKDLVIALGEAAPGQTVALVPVATTEEG